MAKQHWSIQYDDTTGLTLDWQMPNGLHLASVPVRVAIRGENTFYVWGGIDSGEGPPLWAEKEFAPVLFAPAAQQPGVAYAVEKIASGRTTIGYRAIAAHERVLAVLEFRMQNDELRTRLELRNPQPLGGRHTPVCFVELRFEDVFLGKDACYLNAHAYGGRTHGWGRLAELAQPGVHFIHGGIGQALPLVYLYTPGLMRADDPAVGRAIRTTEDGRPEARPYGSDAGVQLEFMLDGRPIAWLRPGSAPGRVNWCVTFTPDRLLEPGQVHTFGGEMGILPYKGGAVEQMRRWRDSAGARFGIVSPPTPEWCRKANIIEFNMNPGNTLKGFTRLDDPKCREMLERWKWMGYTAIFAVSDNHVGLNWLSPFDYDPCDAVGGEPAERQMLAWAHELGLRIFLWVTTVGIDRQAPEVREHRDWFTQRPNGEYFYAWDSKAPDYVGYAPDGDPMSTGWRAWLKNQAQRVVGRGYDGIFIDGCIPRASNHARWAWPGEGRDGVADQVCELAEFVRGLGPDLITFVEDEFLAVQGACEMTVGRYTAMPPFLKKAYWDHGMGGGPEAAVTPPARIPPEMARDYLLVRYASLLPDVVSNDIAEGYYSEECRPWTVQSLVAGAVPKTHNQYVDDAATFRRLGDAPEPSDAEKQPDRRIQGTNEFLHLMRFCRDEPLVRDVPLTIEGVAVEGDGAVVGILRPGDGRALLVLMQFANRSARVKVWLAAPVDVPATQRDAAGRPDKRAWRVREIMHSMVDPEAARAGRISGRSAYDVEIAPYGFPIFELT